MYKITSRTLDAVGAQRGWKAREAAAKAKLAKPIDDHVLDNLRLAGERDQAERDAVAAAIAEQERIRRETACPCPACGGGEKHLTVEEAAFIASALSYYRSKSFKTDPEQYAVQNGRARAAQAAKATVIPTLDEASPADHAETVEEAVAQLDTTPKPKRRR